MVGRRWWAMFILKALIAKYTQVLLRMSRTEKTVYANFHFPAGFPAMFRRSARGRFTEGGEFGYIHSATLLGAAFDNPELIVACIVGDGEAETGPLATAWHSNKFLNPITDGAVLPILHLNGYK